MYGTNDIQFFPETTGFMIAIQDHVISTNNYKKCILKDPNITNDICRKCREKLEGIQHITGACCALAQDDYTHRHNKVAIIVHQELAIKYGLAKGSPMPYYKYEPHSVLENSIYKLRFDRSIITVEQSKTIDRA
jgi:hypothetical protein